MTSLLPHYQALKETSEQMACAARLCLWNEVTRLEGVASTQVAAYLAASGGKPATAADKHHRLQALKAILQLDAQVRALAEPHWQKVTHWLGDSSASRQGQVGAYFADTNNKH